MTKLNDPLLGQRQLVGGAAVVQLPGLVVSVTGPDAITFLESLTSQQLANLNPGESAESLLLDANGHVEAQLACVRTADGVMVWIPAAQDAAQASLDWLIKMRFRKQVEFAVSDLLPVAACAEPAVSQLRAASTSVWRDPWPEVTAGGVAYGVMPDTQWHLEVGFISEDDLNSLLANLDLAPLAAFNSLRIAVARPMLFTEDDAKLLPHEVDWLRTAVHLEKGCYRGQETVAKVHNLGHPPRRLVLLDLDGSLGNVPEPGSQLLEVSTGKMVGHVTVSGMHWEDGLIALALVKRGLAEDSGLYIDTEDGQVAAVQRTVVSPDAGGAALGQVRALRQARRH